MTKQRKSKPGGPALGRIHPVGKPIALEKSGREAGEILERLKNAVDVKTDAELAALLGVKQTALSNWRVRNSVPLGRLRPVCKQFAVPLDYLLTGRFGTFDGTPLDTELLGYVFRLLERYEFLRLPETEDPGYDPARRAAAEFLDLQSEVRKLFKQLTDAQNLTIDEAKRAIVSRLAKE